jgi:hypothetical protein
MRDSSGSGLAGRERLCIRLKSRDGFLAALTSLARNSAIFSPHQSFSRERRVAVGSDFAAFDNFELVIVDDETGLDGLFKVL